MTSREAYSTTRTGTLPERAAALAGLALALVLLRLPFRHTVRAVRWARRLGHRPLTPARAEALVAAVRHAGRWWPGRVACAETSLGSVLAAAFLRQDLTWCLGARFLPPPTEYHAWVELPGVGPVGEYTEGGRHHHAALRI
ncbi:lasso peptide biosynthesis B2 protein [Streptomyces jumonjinensis]|uniref:Lasso peptide biosynthesis B2 protein n=1 Tax=Streptomyces jumonjinensis TaxID=1945 RepID=A0A646KLT3_STRJU|nr:lasso peptide biosynthesis B2 protein [Streptomyces jumonjinensis]MQT03050.1 lasso peptide biosynthesis B2 protein [Streptomyces jumonjinensis]